MPTSETDINRLLGQVITKRRKELKLSQDVVAQRANHSRTYYSDIERGLRNISVMALHNIAQALETEACTLLAQVEAMRAGNSHQAHLRVVELKENDTA